MSGCCLSSAAGPLITVAGAGTSVVRASELDGIKFLADGYMVKSWEARYRLLPVCVKVYTVDAEPDPEMRA